MNKTEVSRTFEGRDAVVDFLLEFKELRLESIMSVRDLVVAAHSFDTGGGSRAVATTLYELSDLAVVIAECADVRRR